MSKIFAWFFLLKKFSQNFFKKPKIFVQGISLKCPKTSRVQVFVIHYIRTEGHFNEKKYDIILRLFFKNQKKYSFNLKIFIYLVSKSFGFISRTGQASGHMKGYAGSRDYVGIPAVSVEDLTHIYISH